MTHQKLSALLCACVLLASSPVMAAYARKPVSSVPTIGQVSEKTRFAKAIEDLPLMAGLELDDSNDVVFIFGSNRIAQTTAKGWVDIDAVYYYYQDTLPELGWKQISTRLYERNGEMLHLNASSANADGMTYVTFEVEPR